MNKPGKVQICWTLPKGHTWRYEQDLVSGIQLIQMSTINPGPCDTVLTISRNHQLVNASSRLASLVESADHRSSYVAASQIILQDLITSFILFILGCCLPTSCSRIYILCRRFAVQIIQVSSILFTEITCIFVWSHFVCCFGQQSMTIPVFSGQ